MDLGYVWNFNLRRLSQWNWNIRKREGKIPTSDWIRFGVLTQFCRDRTWCRSFTRRKLYILSVLISIYKNDLLPAKQMLLYYLMDLEYHISKKKINRRGRVQTRREFWIQQRKCYTTNIRSSFRSGGFKEVNGSTILICRAELVGYSQIVASDNFRSLKIFGFLDTVLILYVGVMEMEEDLLQIEPGYE